jgi:hypothetical protein
MLNVGPGCRPVLPAVFAIIALGASAWGPAARSEPSGNKNEPQASRILRDTQRWLRATGWGDAFQHGIRKVVSSASKAAPFLERVLDAKPVDLEAVVAPVFAKRLSEPEARAMADFYETSTGRRIIERQSVNTSDPTPPISLTVEQRREYDRFDAGVGGRAVRRVLSDTRLRDDYLDAIRKRFNRQIQ